MKFSKKNLLILSIACLSMRFFIMVGSSFSLSEALVYFNNFDELLNSSNGIVHTLFASIFRPIMPAYLFPVIYYIDREFFHKNSFILLLFCTTSLLLFLNNILIYNLGAYSFIAMKNIVIGTLSDVDRSNLITHYKAIYDLVQMILNEVINAIYVPLLEILRGLSLILLFRGYKISPKYLSLGLVILIFDFFVVIVHYLSFLNFEFTFLSQYDFTEHGMIYFQYWIFFGLSFLLFKKWKSSRALEV